jgi:hypothetical protein
MDGVTMFPSLRALLSGLIDYAGLFPPANLPLDEAIRLYANYREGPDAWMLGRFICPAARLGELDAFAHIMKARQPFSISAIARAAATIEDLNSGLCEDFKAISTFRMRHGQYAAVDFLEIRLPPHARLGDQLLSMWELLEGGVQMLALFFETAPRAAAELIPFLPAVSLGRPPGFKLRCGGLEAAAFPSSQDIAQALQVCLTARIPFKATAGLHHPLPRFDAGVNARMHGFVNLFVAGVLSQVHHLDVSAMAKILDETDPAHFTFDPDGLGWQDLRASTAQVAKARAGVFLSFGSCSFDEPRADLQALGWME